MRRTLAVWALLVLAAPVVAGCDDGDDPAPAGGPAATSGTDGADTGDGAAADVPEECREAFPQAFTAADLGELALLPDGFPDPPVEATLCLTAETVGGANETASYATTATAEEVLAGYEAALASYGATRDQDGLGRPIVTATAGDVVIQVTPQDGGFVLVLAG
ncbi:hypothetical protein [Nocardioides humi]|uniref:Lipoprotein n=1 Tax=Nocardioides humi TaxID=449461 RepID=A0ABN2BG14_9ACTN|nr:hypothetical protein [Nocardioides humi]